MTLEQQAIRDREQHAATAAVREARLTEIVAERRAAYDKQYGSWAPTFVGIHERVESVLRPGQCVRCGDRVCTK